MPASTAPTLHPRPRTRSASAYVRAGPTFLRPPAPGSVVGDDLLEHRHESGLVDRLALPNGDRPPGLVVVAGGDDALGIGDDPSVVEKDVDVILCGKQRADVAFEHEVGLNLALNGLLDRGIGGVDKVADPVTDPLLPPRQWIDVGVDTRVLHVAHDPSVSDAARFKAAGPRGGHLIA
jgi:hypothetical protein